MLVEPVGRAEEDIALQAHTLDLTAIGGENCELLGPSVQRRAIFRAIEAELDRVHPAGADRKGGAADDDADQNAGDEADLKNEDRDREQRGIFEQRNSPRRVDQPLVNEMGAEIEQQTAKHEFGYVSEKAGISYQHQHRHGRHSEAGEAAAGAGHVVERGAVERDGADIAAKPGGNHVGDADGLQFALEIGLALGEKFEPGGVEQRADGGHEHDGEQIAGECGQDIPWEHTKIVEVPSRREPGRGRSFEQPTIGLCGRHARSGDREDHMRQGDPEKQNGRQDVRTLCATAQAEIDDECDGDCRQQLRED